MIVVMISRMCDGPKRMRRGEKGTARVAIVVAKDALLRGRRRQDRHVGAMGVDEGDEARRQGDAARKGCNVKLAMPERRERRKKERNE